MHSSYLLALSYSLMLRLKTKFAVRMRYSPAVLFDLFDFNEIQTVSVMDLEFLLQCCLTSAAKIYDMSEDVNEVEISELVRNSFLEKIRITLPQLLR